MDAHACGELSLWWNILILHGKRNFQFLTTRQWYEVKFPLGCVLGCFLLCENESASGSNCEQTLTHAKASNRNTLNRAEGPDSADRCRILGPLESALD